MDLGLVRSGNGISVFWMPVLDGEDKPYEPEIFSEQAIRLLRQEGDAVWLSQYLLRGPEERVSEFDESTLRKAMYDFDRSRMVLTYPGHSLHEDRVDAHGHPLLQSTKARVRLENLRFYLHCDPKHRSEAERRAPGKGRPAKAAIAVVGVGPDHHAFLVDYWNQDATLETTARALFAKYCLWAPQVVTFEAVTAQFWLREYVRSLERSDAAFMRPRAHTLWGQKIELPRMSTRMEEAEDITSSKEEIYRDVLGGWIHRGVFHLDADRHETPLRQFLNSGNVREAVDLLDAISQGPPVWQAPPEPSLLSEARGRLAYVETYLSKNRGDRNPNYADAANPWRKRRRMR